MLKELGLTNATIWLLKALSATRSKMSFRHLPDGMISTLIVLVLMLLATSAYTADVMTYGTFDTDLTGWYYNVILSDGTRAWDGSIYGLASGSIRYRTTNGRRNDYELYDSTYISTAINSDDNVYLSFYYRKAAS